MAAAGWSSLWVALLPVVLAGCAILPAIGVGLAAQGAQGLVALSLGPMVAAREQADKDRCAVHSGRGVSITETLETTVPTGEGEVAVFEPAHWRLELAREGYPQVERSRTPIDGALAITDRSVAFVPPPGAMSVRIPYELVQGVEVTRSADDGEARSMIVRSCYGRYDIVTFGQLPPGAPDPGATTDAAARLTARVTTFRAAADN
jgi:hypothetical protein